MLKRTWCILCAAAILMISMPTASAVGTSASAAILMEAESGRILYAQNIHERRLIASITKLMTALVALESGQDLKEERSVRTEWTGVEGSSIYLQPGERTTLECLLYGMLLRSGNDAAVAVAGCCGGSVEAFAEQMNRKAAALGMTNSHFSNPSGLNAPDHYSTAYDMALLARACLKNETLAQMVSTRSITLGTRSFTNHNKLLWQYEGCIGMKTGYTEKAGRTLVSAAQRDGMTLICVTLNDPNDWSDHAALYDYGFSNWKLEPLAEPENVVCRLPVEGSLLPFCPVMTGVQLSFPLAKGEQITRTVHLEETQLTASVPAGHRVGEMVYSLGNDTVARIALVTGDTVKRNTVPQNNLWNGILAGFGRK